MKTKIILSSLLLTFSFSACTDLSEKVYSEIPMDNFFKNEQELIANAGRAYTKLQDYTGEQSLWTLVLQASDECAVPPDNTGEQWGNGRYWEIQNNKIPAANKLLRLGWDFIFKGVAACNEVLYETALSPVQFEGKDKIIAEIKILRAFFYYQGIDCFANIPFATDFKDTSYPPQKNRAFMFDFIVNEIKSNIDKLDEVPDSYNYGRITQGMAYTLLAKMYLNAKEWIGKDMWTEAEAACDKVIAQGHYSIEDDFKTNFAVKNEVSKENIFTIVFSSVYTKDKFYLATITLNPASRATYNILEPWDTFICQPDFFKLYEQSDKRREAYWIFGQQKDMSGNNIVINGEPFIYNADVDESVYDKNVGRQKWDGARCGKWEYQKEGPFGYDGLNMENDFAIFRYADIVMMKVECMVRGGRAEQAALLADFQKIRTRAGLQAYTGAELTLDALLAERGREFAWEGTRRQDLIRYGKFGNKWWAKSAEANPVKIFPIPQDALNSNPNLKQN